MKVTMTPIGFKKLQRDLKKMSKDNAVKVGRETYASGLDVQREARKRLKEMKAWDTGNLAISILVEPTKDGKNTEIGPTAPYGPYVEFGTKKHFPPPDALEDWARRHGFKSAWPICKAIAERGLQAKPFLLPAYVEVKDKFYKRLQDILKR